MITRAVLAFLRLRPVRWVFLLVAPLIERLISHYYGAKKVVIGEASRAEIDARFAALVDARSEEALMASVEHALSLATPAAQRRFLLWAEERSALHPSGLTYAERTFAGLRSEIESARGSLEGLRILEIGPGQTLVSGVLFYVHGAASYTAVDLFPEPEQDPAIFRRLREHLPEEKRRRFDEAVTITESAVALDPARVLYRHPVDAAKLPFPDGSFDVVISLASFEHFQDPEAAVRECARVTAPRGVGLHQIDFRDHRDFQKPLEFLRHGDAEWRKIQGGTPAYTNRLRRGDFERAFRAASFEVARVHVNARTSLSPELRAQLDARFRDLSTDELETLSAFFVVTRAA